MELEKPNGVETEGVRVQVTTESGTRSFTVHAPRGIDAEAIANEIVQFELRTMRRPVYLDRRLFTPPVPETMPSPPDGPDVAPSESEPAPDTRNVVPHPSGGGRMLDRRDGDPDPAEDIQARPMNPRPPRSARAAG